jgi:hypothetical protein
MNIHKQTLCRTCANAGGTKIISPHARGEIAKGKEKRVSGESNSRPLAPKQETR